MKTHNAMRRLVLSGLLAASAATLPALAQVSISIAPPALRYEPVPMVAPGYVWAPGYWAWHDDRHIWIRGRAIVQRTGYRWKPERWAPDASYRRVKEYKAQKPKHNNGRQNG